jgi:hypothetical protein
VWNGNQSGTQLSATTQGTFVVIGTNEYGCSNSDSVGLTVFTNVSVDAGGQVEVCSNELPAELTATTSAQVNTFIWSNGEGSSSIFVYQSGAYEVSVTDSNGCVSTDEVQLTVLTSPSVNAGADQVVCENEFPVTLNATGSGGSVLWNTGSQSPFTSISSPGLYSVSVTSSNGCVVSDTVEVILESCAAIEELWESISLYPNPSFNDVNVLSLSPMNGYYKVLTNDGKLILNGDLDSEKHLIIDVVDLSQGIYILRLELENGIKDFRVIKQ